MNPGCDDFAAGSTTGASTVTVPPSTVAVSPHFSSFLWRVVTVLVAPGEDVETVVCAWPTVVVDSAQISVAIVCSTLEAGVCSRSCVVPQPQKPRPAPSRRSSHAVITAVLGNLRLTSLLFVSALSGHAVLRIGEPIGFLSILRLHFPRHIGRMPMCPIFRTCQAPTDRRAGQAGVLSGAFASVPGPSNGDAFVIKPTSINRRL